MKFLSNLIPGVSATKLIVIGLVAASVIGWVTYTRHTIKSLRADNIVLVQNNKVLQENVDTVKDNLAKTEKANGVLLSTIGDLQKERDNAKAAADALSKEKKSNTKVIGDLQKQLEKLKKDPVNNGPLAPVLRETIRGIQETGVTP